MPPDIGWLMQDAGAEWMAAMRRGDHGAAWKVSDAVRAARDPATRDDPRLPYHLRWVWDGRGFNHRHVLVRCYHGLGDTLQFIRYLPALRRRAASVALEVQPGLMPLLRGFPGVDTLIPFDVAQPTPPSECDLEIMELAAALRLEPDVLPLPYLHVRPRQIAAAMGLCWRAGDWNAGRSVPPALLAPLTRRPCVSLCPGPTDLAVMNQGGCPPGVADTAALIAALPLVITVDTMVAHLAGALNIPTRLLLRHEADWRWMDARSDSPWYPSMRLYRQSQPGDWAPVVAQAASDLPVDPSERP